MPIVAKVGCSDDGIGEVNLIVFFFHPGISLDEWSYYVVDGDSIRASADLTADIVHRFAPGFKEEIEGSKLVQDILFLAKQLTGNVLLGGFAEYGSQIQQLLCEDLEDITPVESGTGSLQQNSSVLEVEVAFP